MKNRNIVENDNWETPDWLIDKLDEEFHFDFDPCPLMHGQIPDEKNGLLIEWGECNFVNPPYSRMLKEAFIRRSLEMSKKGKTCVLLIPVSTSTSIFHDVIKPNADEIRFLRGRISFKGVNSKGEYTETGKPMHDSMIIVFRGKHAKNN